MMAHEVTAGESSPTRSRFHILIVTVVCIIANCIVSFLKLHNKECPAIWVFVYLGQKKIYIVSGLYLIVNIKFFTMDVNVLIDRSHDPSLFQSILQLYSSIQADKIFN